MMELLNVSYFLQNALQDLKIMDLAIFALLLQLNVRQATKMMEEALNCAYF